MDWNKQKKTICIILGLLTVIAGVLKIYISVDIDEAYIVATGGRLLQGDHLFKEMWELTQTSGFVTSFFMYIFRAVTGTYDGVVIYLRITMTILQWGLAFLFYVISRKYYPNTELVAFFIANFTSKSIQTYEYSFLAIDFILLMMICFMELYHEQNLSKVKKNILTISAAIFYSIALLCYPTMILTILIMPYILWKALKDYRKEGFVLFGLGCLICLILFLSIVFQHVSVSEFVENIQAILMDGSHSNKRSFWIAMLPDPRSKQMWMMICGSVVLWVLGRKKCADRQLILVNALLINAVMMFSYNIIGIFSKHPVTIQIRYLLIVTMGLFFMKVADNELLKCYFVLGFAMLFGGLLGSNEILCNLVTFLIPCIVTVFLQGSVYMESKELHIKKYVYYSFMLFTMCLIVAKANQIRITGCGPANLTQSRVKAEAGPYKGIWMYPEDEESYTKKLMDLSAHVSEQDVISYMGNNSILNLCVPGKFSSPNITSTPVYNEEWILYYERRYIIPNVIILDKDNFDDLQSFLESNVYGTYIKDEMCSAESKIEETEMFYYIWL